VGNRAIYEQQASKQRHLHASSHCNNRSVMASMGQMVAQECN
jgi:hypothetical protein